VNDDAVAQFERLQAQLQDAHLVIGEQTIVLRKYQTRLEQLQAQIEQLQTLVEQLQGEPVEEIPTSREEGNV
jgi:cell division protein FtsB